MEDNVISVSHPSPERTQATEVTPVISQVLSPCMRITRSKFSSVVNVPKIIKIKKKVLDQPHVHSQLEGFPVKARKGRPPKIKKALEIE